MSPAGHYRIRVDVLVPVGLPSWVARQLGVSEARARRIVDDAVRAQAQLVTKSAEVLEGEPRMLVFTSNFAAAPREGERWFECGRGVARVMVNGRSKDEENGR